MPPDRESSPLRRCCLQATRTRGVSPRTSCLYCRRSRTRCSSGTEMTSSTRTGAHGRSYYLFARTEVVAVLAACSLHPVAGSGGAAPRLSPVHNQARRGVRSCAAHCRACPRASPRLDPPSVPRRLSLADALCGTVIQLQTLDGRPLQIPVNEVLSPQVRAVPPALVPRNSHLALFCCAVLPPLSARPSLPLACPLPLPRRWRRLWLARACPSQSTRGRRGTCASGERSVVQRGPALQRYCRQASHACASTVKAQDGQTHGWPPNRARCHRMPGVLPWCSIPHPLRPPILSPNPHTPLVQV